MAELTPLRWFEANPRRLASEIESMRKVAPEMDWKDDMEGTSGGGWRGLCPVWPFERPQPDGLDGFLAGRRFLTELRCSAAHPVAAPQVMPLDPEPDLFVRTAQEWHVLGDGALCLLQNTLDWTGRELASELIRKAAGWYLEYLLLRRGEREAMTVNGIVEDDGLDHLFVPIEKATSPSGGNSGD